MSVKNCAFCKIQSEAVLQNDHCYALFDNYPVTEGHMLIIPKRHFAYYFGMTYEENNAVYKLLEEAKNLLLEKYNDISGFNIGINVGEAAGQTIFHCHIHLIPRRKGDLENPRGGVRGVIPERRNY